jgi:hypothetical protein
MPAKEYWMYFNVVKDITSINAALEEVHYKYSAPRKSCECLHDFQEFKKVRRTADQVVTIGQELGLDNIAPDIVTELL